MQGRSLAGRRKRLAGLRGEMTKLLLSKRGEDVAHYSCVALNIHALRLILPPHAAVRHLLSSCCSMNFPPEKRRLETVSPLRQQEIVPDKFDLSRKRGVTENLSLLDPKFPRASSVSH